MHTSAAPQGSHDAPLRRGEREGCSTFRVVSEERRTTEPRADGQGTRVALPAEDTMLNYALLWLLREEPDYGYRLRQRFEARMAGCWPLNIGQVYQTLQRLERAGLVAEVRGSERARRPARRIFEPTAKGIHTLERWLDVAPIPPRTVRDEALVRLFIFQGGQYPGALPRIGEEEQRAEQRLVRVVAEKHRLWSGSAAPDLLRDTGMEAEILYAEAHLRWLRYCRQRLEEIIHPAGRPAAANA
jgi:DNA-binding PadR family transcriptional regulator